MKKALWGILHGPTWSPCTCHSWPTAATTLSESPWPTAAPMRKTKQSGKIWLVVTLCFPISWSFLRFVSPHLWWIACCFDPAISVSEHHLGPVEIRSTQVDLRGFWNKISVFDHCVILDEYGLYNLLLYEVANHDDSWRLSWFADHDNPRQDLRIERFPCTWMMCFLGRCWPIISYNRLQ